MKNTLIDQAHRLVVKTSRERADFEGVTAEWPAFGNQRRRVAGQFVEIIEDGGAFDQHIAPVQDEGRHAPQGIKGSKAFGIAEG